MSNEERGRILRMVSEGKLTPSEAEELLASLDPTPAPSARPPLPPMPPAPLAPGARRTLVIQVSEDGLSKVNVRIPLGLARAAGKFIPRQAIGALAEHDIDLEQLLSGLGNAEDGTLLEVNDGADKVRIAVE